MSEPKDHKNILAAYGFKDPLGHSLEMCGDYLDLLRELEELRKEAEPAKYTPEVEQKIKKNVTPRR